MVPSANLTGTVNGVFRGSVNKIYSDIAKAFNLISYDDGAALYVYAAGEVSVQSLALGAAKLPIRVKIVTRLDAGVAHSE